MWGRPIIRACTAVLAAVALAGFAGAFTVLAPASPGIAQAAPVKIMPLGDSITGSPGCWRALLWNMLQNAGYTNIHFVGTLPPQGCGIPYDGNNEGHGGALATGIVSQNLLPGWLAATNPDIVMMHLGTNDVWNGSFTTAQILAAYTTLVQQMRANNPAMKILVAQIIPMNPSGCSYCAQGVVNLDAAIPAWATSLTTAQSPIVVVNQWTGFNDATDTVDGVHPNDAGNQKIASKWYPALTQFLTVTSSPSPTPTPSGTPSPTSSSTPSTSPSASPSGTPSAGACTAAYSITNQWQGGFQGQVTVTNTGNAPTQGWTVRFTFANGQTITQSWNGTLTQSGAAVTVANLSYNGSLGSGASTTFGFLANWTGTNSAPAATCSAAE
jgi:lysophospholipase L1-like esterase